MPRETKVSGSVIRIQSTAYGRTQGATPPATGSYSTQTKTVKKAKKHVLKKHRQTSSTTEGSEYLDTPQGWKDYKTYCAEQYLYYIRRENSWDDWFDKIRKYYAPWVTKEAFDQLELKELRKMRIKVEQLKEEYDTNKANCRDQQDYFMEQFLEACRVEEVVKERDANYSRPFTVSDWYNLAIDYSESKKRYLDLYEKEKRRQQIFERQYRRATSLKERQRIDYEMEINGLYLEEYRIKHEYFAAKQQYAHNIMKRKQAEEAKNPALAYLRQVEKELYEKGERFSVAQSKFNEAKKRIIESGQYSYRQIAEIALQDFTLEGRHQNNFDVVERPKTQYGTITYSTRGFLYQSTRLQINGAITVDFMGAPVVSRENGKIVTVSPKKYAENLKRAFEELGRYASVGRARSI